MKLFCSGSLLVMSFFATSFATASSGDVVEYTNGTTTYGSHCWPYLTNGRNMEGYSRDSAATSWGKVESTFWKKVNGVWTTYGPYTDFDRFDATVAIARWAPAAPPATYFYINSKHWRYDEATTIYTYMGTTTIFPCS